MQEQPNEADGPATSPAAPNEKKPGSKKSRRLKRQFVDWIFKILGAPVIGGLCNLLAHTLRLRYDGYDHYAKILKSGRPIVFAFWHEDLLSIFLAHLRQRPGKIGVMLSQSRDGEKVAQIIQRYDLTPIRASSSRGAVRGFLELYRWLAKPKTPGLVMATIAIDGPRGPRRVAKGGAVMLARKAKALILPIAFNYSNKIVFKSWDRHLMPKPFSVANIFVGEPLDSATWADDDEANAVLLTNELNKLKDKAGLP